MEIKKTKNYSIFKFDTNKNRTINYPHLMRLKDAITKNNLLSDNPIVVDEFNVVIDGQHRLMAAQQLGADVYYFVAQKMTISDTASINGTSRKWKVEDYLELYAKAGNPNYLWIKSIKSRYEFLTLTQILKLGNYGDQFKSKSDFCVGKYEANDIEFAEKVALYVNDYKELTKFFFHTSFINAIEYLVGIGVYDHSRMMQKMRYAASKLRPQVNANGYIKNLEEIANYQTGQKNRVIFPEKRQNQEYRIDKKLSE